MPDALSKLEEDPRLGRAGELAAYLRDNPRETRRDPEDLGLQFGIDTALAAQIRQSILVRNPRSNASAGRTSLAERARRAWSAASVLMDRMLARPYLFIVLSTLACAPFAIMIPVPGRLVAGCTWVAAQAGCVLMRPKFRFVLFSAALLCFWMWIQFGLDLSRETGPSRITNPVTLAFVAWAIGFALGIMVILVGGILVVVGGVWQVSNSRRREAALSRQDLLARLFVLQQELEAIPRKVPRPTRPWAVAVRQRIFLYSVLVSFVPRSLTAITTLFWHVDPSAISTTSRRIDVGSSTAQVHLSSLNVPVGYLISNMALSITGLAFLIVLGFLTTSWRKVREMLGGVALGLVLAYGWAIPAGGFGTSPPPFIYAGAVSEMTRAIIVVLMIRFSVTMNRQFVRYRLGMAADEATIVSELLEIRHRLSANPVQVCVLVVDAAGSTKMKKDADPLMVEYSFGRYQKWISDTVAIHGGKVDMMTGDGAICAFSVAENALKAAQSLQDEIGNLNAEQNRLPTPFRLRIALHAGAVVADLDKVQFTEVIDVAAHVEKFSPVGGIAMTAPFLKSLETMPDLSPEATVDGVGVYTLPART